MLLRLVITLGLSDSAGVDTQAGAYEVELQLSEHDTSVAMAREFVRDALTRSRYQGRHDDVILAVSEVVTNALLHGQSAPVLRLAGTGSRVRIEVTDNSPVLPVMRVSGPDGGWGLPMVERLAACWGAYHQDDGKVVWCEFAARLAPDAEAPRSTVA